MSKIKIAAVLAVILALLLVANYYINKNANMENNKQEEQVLTKMALEIKSMEPFWHGAEDRQVEFKNISINDNDAFIEFSYPPEGVDAKVYFKKEGGEWQVSREEVVER